MTWQVGFRDRCDSRVHLYSEDVGWGCHIPHTVSVCLSVLVCVCVCVCACMLRACVSVCVCVCVHACCVRVCLCVDIARKGAQHQLQRQLTRRGLKKAEQQSVGGLWARWWIKQVAEVNLVFCISYFCISYFYFVFCIWVLSIFTVGGELNRLRKWIPHLSQVLPSSWNQLLPDLFWCLCHKKIFL